MTLSEELTWRGFVNQTTYKDIKTIDSGSIGFYWGVDPSSDSMQIGNLAAGMMARQFIKHGHKAVLLVGGATGMIGDPDGKAQERDLQTIEQVQSNKDAIAAQYTQIFDGMEFKTVDNYDWFKDVNYLEFLRTVGKNVPMRQMLGREFVQTRLAEDGAGISYAEFSYSLIQGYDFVHLFKEHGVSLQLCGADQWGNSIAGVDLIRRMEGGEAHVWSTPLVINKASGKKFGKTEEGAIWLAEDKTSVYKFYQFWINADDEGVESYMKIYTDLDKEQIDKIMEQQGQDPASRVAQKRLALEVTSIVHGQKRAESVVKISETLFGGGSYGELGQQDFAELKSELATVKASAGSSLVELLVSAGLASSNSDGRRNIMAGSIYLNGQKLSSEQTEILAKDFVDGYLVLRRGKNANALVELV